jgi:hypothetical protein
MELWEFGSVGPIGPDQRYRTGRFCPKQEFDAASEASFWMQFSSVAAARTAAFGAKPLRLGNS